MVLRIIGCGNADRGDDAAGLLVVRRLRALGLEAIEQTGEGVALMESWSGFADVVLVDATAPAGSPGRIRIWNAHAETLPKDALPCSTHGFGVREAVELARAMNCLPRSLWIYGIEASQFAFSAPCSVEVERAVSSVAETLRKLVRKSLQPPPGRIATR